jgi:hypothetical protein
MKTRATKSGFVIELNQAELLKLLSGNLPAAVSVPERKLKPSSPAMPAVKIERTKTEGVGYTTIGKQAGPCMHKHRTLESACRCLRIQRDRWRRAAVPGAVFDRHIERADGTHLDKSELDRVANFHAS